MKSKLIINADDLGFTKGVNEAIKKAHLEGFLSHASLMANEAYFEDAIENVIKKCPDLKIGVHVNLTCGKALYKDNMLAKNGGFKNGFVNLLFRFKSNKVLTHIEKEIEYQILAIQNKGITISHIDGHEHIHIIPSINKIVRKLAEKYHIPRIREICAAASAWSLPCPRWWSWRSNTGHERASAKRFSASCRGKIR